MEQGKSSKRPFLKWLFLASAAMLPVAVVLLVALAPYIIKTKAIRSLETAGADSASIEDVDFNPLSGVLVVSGLSAGRAGAAGIEAKTLTVRLSIWELLRKRLVLYSFEVKGARLSVERLKDGALSIGGLKPLARPGSDGREAPGSAWLVRMESFETTDTLVRYLNLGAETTLKADSFKVSGPLTLTPALGGPVLAHDGVVTLAGFAYESKTLKATEKSLTWKGSLSVGPPVRGSERLVTANGTLKGSAPQVALPSRGLHIEHEGLQASVEIQKAGDRFTLLKNLSIKDLKVRHNEKGSLEVASLNAADFWRAPGRLGVGGVQLDGLNATFRRVASRGKPATWLRDWAESSPATFTVLSVTVENAGRVVFEDTTVTPAYIAALTLKSAELLRLDTAPGSPPSPFSVEAQIGEYTLLDLSGTIKPFVKRPTIELAGRVKGLELPPLSPYSAPGLGYNIKSGHLSGTLAVKVVKGVMEGEAEVEIVQLNVADVNEGAISRVSGELGMPLPKAMDLLRDGKGDIRLKVPVSGDIRDPKFGIGDAINKALVKATGKAALSYLKYYFQPYGTLITVAQLAGKVARVRLDPVPFAPREPEPSAEADAYLKLIAGFMTERPKVGIRICGVAVLEDLTGQSPAEAGSLEPDREEALLALALKRSESVKARLVKDHNIEPERLFICAPEVDSKEKGTPRVELLL